EQPDEEPGTGLVAEERADGGAAEAAVDDQGLVAAPGEPRGERGVGPADAPPFGDREGPPVDGLAVPLRLPREEERAPGPPAAAALAQHQVAPGAGEAPPVGRVREPWQADRVGAGHAAGPAGDQGEPPTLVQGGRLDPVGQPDPPGA